MFFQNRVNSILHENNLTGANFPLGLWKYSKFNLKDIGLENEYPDEIDKYCGMFATLGDRRL